MGSSISHRIIRRLFRVRPSWALWDHWALVRGGVRAQALPDDPVLASGRLDRRAGMAPSYLLVAGQRNIDLHVASMTVHSEGATHHGAYVALVTLPEAVAARFPASSFVRRAGTGLLGVEHAVGDRLDLESIRMYEDARLHVSGGSELDWRAFMDPALVDLLAEGIHGEWVQRGRRLLLHSPAPMDSVRRPEPARLDALAVAAVAIERRFAKVAGDGFAVPAVASSLRSARRSEARGRHLSRERARDLSMNIEEQFAELGRYTSAEEVELVRRRIDAGQFRVDHLDDLIHHRRAAFWGAIDDAA